MTWSKDWTIEMVEQNYKVLGMIDPEDAHQLIKDAKALRDNPTTIAPNQFVVGELVTLKSRTNPEFDGEFMVKGVYFCKDLKVVYNGQVGTMTSLRDGWCYELNGKFFNTKVTLVEECELQKITRLPPKTSSDRVAVEWLATKGHCNWRTTDKNLMLTLAADGSDIKVTAYRTPARPRI